MEIIIGLEASAGKPLRMDGAWPMDASLLSLRFFQLSS